MNRVTFGSVLIVVIALVAGVQGGDCPRFRGPAGDGFLICRCRCRPSVGDEGEALLEANAADSWVEIAVRVERPAASERSAGALGPAGSAHEALSSQAHALRLLLLRVLVEANCGTVCVDAVSGAFHGVRLRLVRAASATDLPG